MEINLENAFFHAVKLSIGPFVSSVDVAVNKIQGIILRQTQNILDKPLGSTVIISSFVLILLVAITTSLIIITSVLCIVIIILIVEGFIMGIFIALAATIALTIFTVTIIMMGLISSFKKKELILS